MTASHDVTIGLNLLNIQQTDLLGGLENGITALTGIFSVVLLSLSINAYRKTRSEQTIYLIAVFALFSVRLLLDYLDNVFSSYDGIVPDVLFDILTLAILILFFLSIIRTK